VVRGKVIYASLREYVDQSKGNLNAIRGAFYAPAVTKEFERLRAQGRLEEVADFETAFKKMAAGRADATLAPDMISARLLRENGIVAQTSAHSIDESPPMPVGAYISLRTVSPATRKRFDAALKSMAKDGTVTAIYRRYVGEALAREITVPLPAAPAAN
jgi:polar amino acid transport system substrate-binding protein